MALRHVFRKISPWCIRRRFLSTVQNDKLENVPEKQQASAKSTPRGETTVLSPEKASYRFVYPEFLPNPQMNLRHAIREKLERMDMLKRRSVINIPEFYVGSILAVTVSDLYAPGKQNRFVGICILREGEGLKHRFTLRNVVDHQGVEIMYDLYSPLILNMEVLKLEKRLDDHLLYLRDAPPEFSTFPFDMEPELHPEGLPMPVNPLKIKLKPQPWTKRWELKDLKGVEGDLAEYLSKFRLKKYLKRGNPWEEYEKYDLMKEYRRTIPEEEQVQIWDEIHQHKVTVEDAQRRERRRKLLKKPGRK